MKRCDLIVIESYNNLKKDRSFLVIATAVMLPDTGEHAAARARSDRFKTYRDLDLVAALLMGKQVIVV